MGFACPVCGVPQSDREHLANHLAFTALLGDDEHESWLDDRAPGWADQGPDELAPRIVDHVEETEFPQAFEDTTGHDHGGEERPGDLLEEESTRESAGQPGDDRGSGDPETRRIVEEARRMTERMLDEEASRDEDDGENQ